MGPIDPNLLHFALVVVLGGIVLLAVTYLLEFFGPLLIALALLIVAYLIYKFLTTGTIGF